MKKILSLILAMLALQACANQPASSQSASDTAAATATVANAYLDYSGRDDVLSGGVKMIPITTPKGVFRVWTKRIGANPTIKVLLPHRTYSNPIRYRCR